MAYRSQLLTRYAECQLYAGIPKPRVEFRRLSVTQPASGYLFKKPRKRTLPTMPDAYPCIVLGVDLEADVAVD